MEQIVAVIGALLILAAYAGHQRGVLSHSHAAYHWMNFVGAVVLTVVAYRAQQWGFVLLEGVWAAVSVPPLLRRTPEPGP
ncbi:MAG: CBU_0592 family membrane protein [Candidatus Rokuibacteriota bacterium]